MSAIEIEASLIIKPGLMWSAYAYMTYTQYELTFKHRIKFHLPFAGIIRSPPCSPRFQDKG
jgi:hypothetical protein